MNGNGLKEVKLCHIVCSSLNGVIGNKGKIPWHISEDFKYFKSVTMGSPIVMGRKTFESIGKPLPGRTNIVITRDRSYEAPSGVLVENDLMTALEKSKKLALDSECSKVFIIGGGQIYEETQGLVDEIYHNVVQRKVEGDAFYPVPDSAKFTLVQSLEKTCSGERLAFHVYQKVV